MGMIETFNRRPALGLFLVAAMLASLLALATIARPALAANIAVTTKADENNSDGDCSLREAIIAANTDAPRDACAAGFGVDTVVLPSGTHKVSIAGGQNENTSFTADATVGDLDVTGYTIITGAGARQTKVLAASDFGDRVFDVKENAAIFDLTISGGNPVANQGYQRSGGGIRHSASDLTLSGVVLDGNTAYAGGGIDHQGANLNIHKSTLSNNTADGEPAGSTGVGGGGAILYTGGGELTITNSTIANNNAALEGGAIDNLNDSGATITNSTIAGNTASSGGAIGNAASGLELENTVVADNTDTAPGAGTDNCDGSATSLGTNLEDLDTCGFDQPKDRTDTDPNLGALANNGGPTDTMALPAGSPAIDVATNTDCPSTDQRGEARPADGDANGTPTCDIGAFEREPPPDIIAPMVTRVVPEKNATEVRRSQVIKATFSEAMEESSINTDTFELYEAGASTPVEATVSYDAAKEKALLDPVNRLARGTRYEAIVTTDAEDEAGNHLDQAPGIAGNQRKRWFFTTKN
jgi:CSLREA domain-containing protein